MASIRLSKYQQGLLIAVWKTMPPAVREQLTQESVLNVQIAPEGIAEAIGLITAQRAGVHCKARRRRLDALLDILASATQANG